MIASRLTMKKLRRGLVALCVLALSTVPLAHSANARAACDNHVEGAQAAGPASASALMPGHEAAGGHHHVAHLAMPGHDASAMIDGVLPIDTASAIDTATAIDTASKCCHSAFGSVALAVDEKQAAVAYELPRSAIVRPDLVLASTTLDPPLRPPRN